MSDTDSLYMLTKFKLIEMVQELYQDDKEKRKYLNLRTKADLVEMIQERLSFTHNENMYVRAPPPQPSSYYRPPYTPPPTPSPTPTNERFIQSKYASFMERKSLLEKSKQVAQQKKTSYRQHVSHADEEQPLINPKSSRLKYDDIDNKNAVVNFPE